jgi:uncharacterized protein YndB with AHSA1/START domain
MGVPVEHAYRLFVEPELLTAWLTEAAEVEPRVGGKYELYWTPEDPENNSTIGCRITALAPGELLAFQWRSPIQFKQFANAANPLTHVLVSFHRVDDATRVHLVHSGWREGEEWEEARSWQAQAWRGALAALEKRG